MNLEDALQLFMRRVDVIVSMEMGGKIPTREAYREIKDEVRKLKKIKKQIHHEAIAAADPSASVVSIDNWLDWSFWYLVWTGYQWALRSYEREQVLIIFDLETDGLLHAVTKIHCIVCYDTDTGTTHIYNDEGDQDPIIRGITYLEGADCIVGHNIIGYDIPVIR